MRNFRMKVTQVLVMGGALCMLIGCLGEEGSSASLEKAATSTGGSVVLEVQGKLYLYSDFDRYMTTIAGESVQEARPGHQKSFVRQFY